MKLVQAWLEIYREDLMADWELAVNDHAVPDRAVALGESMKTVVRVVPRENYQLEIEFNTGEVRLFHVRPYLDKGIFCQLKNKTLFEQAYVAFDTVCWPNDLDIAPETLYVKSVPISGAVHEKPEEDGECP